ncbi:MAG: hypothetical protein GAK30_03303 [Paracidovorax wautersii]|uniref:Uncharacterized protein n=1 Tax=Paracidovorax wautersii TaxID=1177982 RepID=A0A7V8FLB0_9BURK|nr:MAG: hypothetical protein GAK30_03303 [Paracidovorax wautersii]
MYTLIVNIEFDPAKNEANIAARGISFEQAADFDFDSAFIKVDTREDYGETRYQALGYIGGRLHYLVFTARNDRLRIISLRKANAREVKLYDQAT